MLGSKKGGVFYDTLEAESMYLEFVSGAVATIFDSKLSCFILYNGSFLPGLCEKLAITALLSHCSRQL